MEFYGRSAQDSRYAAYGSIGLFEYSGGGGWSIASGGSVAEGPSPFTIGKNRYIRLVKVSVSITPVEDRGDGIQRRNVAKTKYEELYALSGSKLLLSKRTTLSEESVEEEGSKP